MTRRILPVFVAVALFAAPFVAPPAFAHEPGAGAHGGVRVDAGHLHAELVADGSPAVSVFLSNGADKPISAEGYKANAILLVNGKTQRFALTPAGDGRLSGTAAEPVPHGVKGVVQITAPDGSTAQAKY